MRISDWSSDVCSSDLVAAYTLHEENRLIADPNNPTEQAQIGKTRNRGIELELKTEIGRQFDLIANYHYIDLDEQLEGLPKHQASFWGKYRFAIGNVTGLRSDEHQSELPPLMRTSYAVFCLKKKKQ